MVRSAFGEVASVFYDSTRAARSLATKALGPLADRPEYKVTKDRPRANVSDVGERMEPTAVPYRVSSCGLPLALSVTVKYAIRSPVAVGAKVTLMLQPEPTGKLEGQLFVCVKSELFAPVMAILDMVRVAVPELARWSV